MALGKKTGGRKPGSTNKRTVAVKDAIEQTFKNNGGVAWMTRWAEANPDEFFRLLGKLLPREITGADGGAIKQKLTVIVKRDRNFFGRNTPARPVGAPDTDPGEPGPV